MNCFQEVVRHRTLGRRALTLKVDKALFLFRDGSADVNHGEQHENVGLQKADEEMQADKYDGNDNFCQRDECRINLLTGKHICEKPNCEGERTGKMTDKFDGQHKPSEPPERSKKLLDVTKAMRTNTGVVIERESRNS